MDDPAPPLLDISIVLHGNPRGKGAGRLGTRRWVDNHTGELMARAMIFSDGKTRSEEAAVRLFCQTAMSKARITAPVSGPIRLSLNAYFRIPPSWPLKKRMAARTGAVWPTGKPDLDNIEKLLLDGSKTVVFLDDAQIVQVWKEKTYSDTPRVVARFQSMEPPDADA